VASNGYQSILEIVPEELHQRVPFYVGNRSLVEKAEQFIHQDGEMSRG
jgi:fructose-1,6-bisphosphatase I